jgi:hypothetical protein
VLEPSASIRPERLEAAFEIAAFVPSDEESLRPQAAVALARRPAARTSRRTLLFGRIPTILPSFRVIAPSVGPTLVHVG